MKMNTETKILIVDDFATMRRIIRITLNSLGCMNIDEADDGDTALPMLRSESYGLVITDWNMPGMPGIDLLQMIRSDKALLNIPVLMITAESKRELIVQAIEAGVNDYLVKPFHRDALIKKVSRLIASKSDSVNPVGIET
jgi:two-component system chemotaxis response regulator CheY